MSKTKIILLIAGVIGILFVGCLLTGMIYWMSSSRPHPTETVTPEQMQVYRIEIDKVILQMQSIYADTVGKEVGKTPAAQQANRVAVLKKYDDELFKIDVSNCPPDFQAAYLELIRSLEKVKNFLAVHSNMLVDVTAMASDNIWGIVGNMGKFTQEGQAINTKLLETESEFRLTIKKYNAKGF